MTTTPMTAVRTPHTGTPVLELGPTDRSANLPGVYDTAASTDGMWHYEQEENHGRVQWRAYLVGADELDPTACRWSLAFRSLDEARQATATWLLDQLISDAITRDRYDAEDRATRTLAPR